MNELSRTREDIWKVIEQETGVQVDSNFRTQYVDVWREWFRGYRQNFHKYNEKVLGEYKAFYRKSLGPGGKAANAWAELLTREFPVIAVSDKDLQERIHEILKGENFKEQLVKYLELAFGVGTAGVVEYIVEDTPHIDFLDVDDMVPLSWRNGMVTELATINLFTDEGRYYTHIQYNKDVQGNYVIENTLYVSDDENDIGVKIDPAAMGIDDVVFMGVKPFFQIISPNIINKIDVDSPLGVSVFNEHIDTLMAIDNKYTEFDAEFCLGKKRIVVSSDALKKEINTETGQFVSYLGSDTVYQAVNRADGEPLFEAIDFTLRDQSYINALNQEFNFLADGIGMDAGTFVFNGVSMKTATEVISEKSKTFGSKQKHDKMLKTVIHDCVMSLIHCLEAIEGRRYDVEVTVTMSDAVLIDSQAKKEDERIDVQSDLMPKTIYLMRNYGLSEEEANEWIQLANEQNGGVSVETVENIFMPGE